MVFDNRIMNVRAKKDDRRINRTKQSLREALIELILEKHYDLITVQDVIDRANVGRSTFYAHFRDKEDLLMGDWQRFLDALVQHFNWENVEEGRFAPVREFFYHLKDFHHFYRALVKSQKVERLFKVGLEYLNKLIDNKMTSLLSDKPAPAVPIPVLSNYLANEIFNLLKWWLDQNMPYPPEQMDEIFHKLVMPGFRSGLRENESRVRSQESGVSG